jgi:hypothetical protein
MLQTSFANDPPDTRRDFLLEEIERSLKGVVESRWAEYLGALTDRFPGPERMETGLYDSAPAPSQPAKKTAQELAEELLDRVNELPKEIKVELAERFRPFDPQTLTGRSLKLSPELRGKLGLTPDQPLDDERLNKLFTALLEMVVVLDNLTWNLWKTIAPKSVVRRESSDGLRRTVGRYLAGDREVATLQITQMLEKTRQLLAGLLSAIGPAGETYARHHMETFAPEKIRAAVEAASPGFLTNVEQKSWRRYLTLAGELSGLAVEKQIVDTIVTYTEEVILGRKPPGAEPPRPSRS